MNVCRALGQAQILQKAPIGIGARRQGIGHQIGIGFGHARAGPQKLLRLQGQQPRQQRSQRQKGRKPAQPAGRIRPVRQLSARAWPAGSQRRFKGRAGGCGKSLMLTARTLPEIGRAHV